MIQIQSVPPSAAPYMITRSGGPVLSAAELATPLSGSGIRPARIPKPAKEG